MRVTERRIDKRGHLLLVPEVEIEGRWTTLEFAEERTIAQYADHATAEQSYCEFKTDLDVERLPSGKFAINALVWPGLRHARLQPAAVARPSRTAGSGCPAAPPGQASGIEDLFIFFNDRGVTDEFTEVLIHATVRKTLD